MLDSGTWQYRIGSGDIVIFSPNDSRYLTNQSEVTGMSWDNLERGYWKGWFKGIGPGDIRKWIEEHILGSTTNVCNR